MLSNTELNLKFLPSVSLRSENSVSVSRGEGQAVPGDPNSSELFTIHTHTGWQVQLMCLHGLSFKIPSRTRKAY